MKEFYLFLQFLSYIRTVEVYKPIELYDQIYYHLSFRIQDFLKFIGKNESNYYQLTKINNFIEKLPELKPLEKYFDDPYFDDLAKKKSILFPVCITGKRNKFSIARLILPKKLYQYKYPYAFNPFFISYQNKYDLEVQFAIINAFSKRSLLKELNLQPLFNKYSRSNGEVMETKRKSVESLDHMEKNNMIESEFIIISDSKKSYRTYQLDPSKLSNVNIIQFYEKLI